MHTNNTLVHLECNQNNYQGLFLTNNAKIALIKIINKTLNKQNIILNIKKSGCLGYKYYIKLSHITDKYIMFKNNNIDLYIQKKNILFIDGTIIDYQIKEFSKKFIFYNKNIQNFCGCGESFNIKYSKEN
ncbi:iron-sulfur cluster assembly accessory protein [Enterobacteriaceae endosymbiont of Neohaemonia nigricornis]|uniref:iron-sulfur cluster assembly accessory protein n=1 Tax=Enterobacteriaceae endosymbiont of Neohaemonia nigricornis TaxID=2675792 RepID=UPI0014493B97|nr:iron-sulfur cluster assembly accessory protein [Enterobacteriaceae endosymbiont of Neohaemonia nigricornis]QJC30537.1 iron-sulfur cluster assembly accessory protein [Enterobacteriaceae endosymbiont of Neohaemonia nigricornis]